jgi:hypothetical protein
MSGARSFVSSQVEESLGLVRGQLDRYPLDQDFVDQFSSVVRGVPLVDVQRPVLEQKMASTLSKVREAALREDGFFVRKARWPGAAGFAVCLTHDVDNISRPRDHLWKTRSRFSLADQIGGLLGIVPVYNNVRLISSKEASYGFHSSFYFLSSNYPLADVRRDSDQMRAAGWEVGLHGDFDTHDSAEKMNEALSRFAAGLGFKPTGVREHYLKFDFEKTWPIMEHAAFDYDTTVGTNDRLGFKLGLASPFHPPDASWSPMNLLELPLILMDTTLWGYLKKSEEEGMADAIRFIDTVQGLEGLLTLLWHQEAVRLRGGRIYWKILKEFKSRPCFVASGAEIARWWRVRSVPLVRDGRLIRLEGDPPKDLVLQLDLAEGRVATVRSGSLDGEGNSRSIRPSSRGFELEVT